MMKNAVPMLTRLYPLIEMARSREDAMWAVLDWAATQPGEFTIKDMHREWVKAGGGGDTASYQQFSTAINNYIYKFDPQSPVAKYRNPRYKFIRVGKTDKGTVPAPLQYVTRGSRGAGAQHVLRWRPGIAPMRQPSGPKKPLVPEGDPIGDALDNLERKLGRPALKAAMQRWRQLGDLHKISTDIMADSQIRGRDKMLALQVAADSLIARGKATPVQADAAEEEMEDEVGGASSGRTPFASPDFEDEERTNPDAAPLGMQQQAGEEGEGEETPDVPEQDDGGVETEPETSDGGPEEVESDVESEVGPEGVQDDGSMRGTLVNDEGQRIPIMIEYDEDEGASIISTEGESYGPYEGYNLEVANGVLTQEAFDDLEEDGWNLVAANQDATEEPIPDEGSDTDDGTEGEEEPVEGEANDDGEDGGEEGPPERESEDFPVYLPEPDEEGDRYERAMFELVDEGGMGEGHPLWELLRGSKDSVDAHAVIKASGLPPRLYRHALIVARAIFDNTGRDFDSGEKKNESKRPSSLCKMYGVPPMSVERRGTLIEIYRGILR